MPAFWVLRNGETTTAVTVHELAAKLDDGDILAQREVPIGPDGTVYVCGSVNARTSSGAFTGDQPFYGTLDQREFTPIKIGGTQEQSQAIQAYCRQTLALG